MAVALFCLFHGLVTGRTERQPRYCRGISTRPIRGLSGQRWKRRQRSQRQSPYLKASGNSSGWTCKQWQARASTTRWLCYCPFCCWSVLVMACTSSSKCIRLILGRWGTMGTMAIMAEHDQIFIADGISLHFEKLLAFFSSPFVEICRLSSYISHISDSNS